MPNRWSRSRFGGGRSSGNALASGKRTRYAERLTMSPFPRPVELTPDLRAQLRALATLAAEQSYAPYSRFRVGAALLLTDGTTVSGCNVENASYRLTCCAEQGAVARAVVAHGPDLRLRAVAVANLNDDASMPCGACRQTLAEFGDDDTVVLFPGEGGESQETTLGALLPHAFRLAPTGK